MQQLSAGTTKAGVLAQLARQRQREPAQQGRQPRERLERKLRVALACAHGSPSLLTSRCPAPQLDTARVHQPDGRAVAALQLRMVAAVLEHRGRHQPWLEPLARSLKSSPFGATTVSTFQPNREAFPANAFAAFRPGKSPSAAMISLVPKALGRGSASPVTSEVERADQTANSLSRESQRLRPVSMPSQMTRPSVPERRRTAPPEHRPSMALVGDRLVF